jgi:hypothetical protein
MDKPIPEAVAQLRRLADVIRRQGTIPSLSLEHIADALTAAQQQGQAVAVELTRDAERYQWLRERAWLHPEAAPACAIFGVDGSMLRSIDGPDLDAAIDQARGTASEAKS